MKALERLLRTPRWTTVGCAALAIALSWLPSTAALSAQMAVYALYGCYLTLWMRADARRREREPAVWMWAAAGAWPFAVPVYLVMSRGFKGLPSSAAVMAMPIVLFVCFVASITHEEVRAENMIREGRRTLQAAGEEGKAGRRSALALFQSALEVDPDNWLGYYHLFLTAYELGEVEIAERYFARLIEQGDALNPDGNGMKWFISATQHCRFALIYWMDRSESRDREVREHAKGQVSRHAANMIAVGQRWRKFLTRVSPQRRELYKNEIGAVEESFAGIKAGVLSKDGTVDYDQPPPDLHIDTGPGARPGSGKSRR